MPEPRSQPIKVPLVLILTFSLLAITVGVGAYIYYLRQEKSIVAGHQEDLLAIADLKVAQLAHWRKERLGDAVFISGSPDLARDLERYLDAPSDKVREAQVLRWFELLKAQNGYSNVIFSDLTGAVKLSEVRLPSASRHISPETLEAIRKGSPALTDLHREADRSLDLALVAPVLGARAPPMGAVLLSIDPTTYLFPLIEAWPTPSPTAETLLVERRGDRVVFLNHLRHRPNEPILFRLPLNSPDLLAAQVLGGHEGVISGVDYRGVPVLGAARRVPGTPWYLIAKVDRSEVQAPIRAQAWWTILISTLLIISAAATVILLWRQQQLRFYRSQYEAEQRHTALAGRYDYLSRYANDIILLFDDSGNILEANERAVATYGHSREELLKLNIRDLREPSTMVQLAGQWDTVRRDGSLMFETTHQRRDGSVFPVEVSSRSTESGGRRLVQSLIRDVTIRQKAEAELRRANRALRMLTNCNEALIRATEEQQLLEELCRIVVEVGGYRLAWVGMAGSGDHKPVHPVAKAGSDEAYLATAGITWADEPRGRGPTGTAIRTGRPVVVKSTDEAGPVTFREAAEAFGYAASVALPLHVEGNVIGALTVYSMELDSFHPDEVRILNELAEDLSFGIQVLRLRAAQTAAEDALRQSQRLETIGRLAGGLAHDFNNYLTVINGYCDVLLDSLPPDDAIREQILDIRKSGGRAAQLTERLLAFSRRQILDLKPCSLNDITRDLENTLRQVTGPDIDVVLLLAPDLWLTMADPVQIERVLMNLVVNARDAVKPGGQIVIRTSNAALDQGALPLGTSMQPGEYVVLTVTDTGTGMDEKTRSHLFEPFFTTKAPGHGTGLGLATVYGIVTQSGGWINVASEPGQGSTFAAHFPRRVPSA